MLSCPMGWVTKSDSTESRSEKAMIELAREPGKSVLVCKATGVIRLRDFESMPEFEELIAEVRPKGLLIDWTELEGWDEEAESARFSIRLELRKHFERAAILGESRWEAEMSRAEEVTGIPIRRFEASERQSALAWLDPDSS